MSGRRRRGRRRPWEQRDAGSPGQPRDPDAQPRFFGPNGQPSAYPPPRGPGGYSGPPRRFGGPGGGGPRRPDGQQHGGPGRWQQNGTGPGAQGNRRWSPGQGAAGAGAYPPSQRWSHGGGHPQQRRPQDAPRRPEPPAVPPGGEIEPFELFCAYHLGITPDGGYRIQNIHEVARRFGTNAAALRQTLTAYGMDAEDIVHSGFDLASAQIDIMVAPEGISRRELARPLFDEFRGAPRRARDWAKEMEEAQRQIEQTIERDGRWSPPPRDPSGKQR